jgi:hypothetical protein
MGWIQGWGPAKLPSSFFNFDFKLEFSSDCGFHIWAKCTNSSPNTNSINLYILSFFIFIGFSFSSFLFPLQILSFKLGQNLIFIINVFILWLFLSLNAQAIEIQHNAPFFYLVYLLVVKVNPMILKYAKMRITTQVVKWTFYISHFLYILLLSLFGYYMGSILWIRIKHASAFLHLRLPSLGSRQHLQLYAKLTR